MIDFGGGMIFPDSYAAPQFSPAEEERQARYEREQELSEEFAWLEELEPDEEAA